MTPLHVLGFDQHADCTACALHEGASHVGMAARLLFPRTTEHADQAVLIVGEAPGAEEDEMGRPFVGRSSREELDPFYIHAPHLRDHADIYGTNSVRCHPPGNVDPTKGQRTACFEYLKSDIVRIAAHYRRLAVLCVGGHSIRSIAPPDGRKERTLDEQYKRQGECLTHLAPNAYIFGTRHPAAIHHDPRIRGQIKNHLIMLWEWLEEGQIRVEVPPVPHIAPPVSMYAGGPIAWDLETDGCLIHGRQTTFHPARMVHVDGLAPEEIITAAGIAWRDADDELHVGIFLWDIPHARRTFLQWMRACEEEWGQNLQYDKKVFRYVLAAEGLDPDEYCPVWRPARELLIESFWADDLAPERSLKAVSRLYRTAEYTDEDKAYRIFESSRDPKLIDYLTRDAYNTYRGVEVALATQHERFSAHPVARAKLTPWRKSWSTAQVATAVLIEESGIVFDRTPLMALHDRQTEALDRLIWSAREQDGLIIAGEGSTAPILSCVVDAANYVVPINRVMYGEGSPELEAATRVFENLERTDKGKDLSTNANNRNLLLGVLPLSDPVAAEHARKLSLIGEVASLKKIIGSYTETLLHGKGTEVCDYEEIPTQKHPKWCIQAEDDLWHYIERGRKPKIGIEYGFQVIPACGARDVLGTDLIVDKVIPTCPTCYALSKQPKGSTKRRKIPGSERVEYDPSDALIEYPTPDGRDLGIAYPHYFIVPKSPEGGERGGGVRQARWSAKGPPIQTLPPVTKKCLTTRYTPGVLFVYDLAQIEWRMGMWLPNDRRGLEEIATGYDVHLDAAEFLLAEYSPNPITHTEEWCRTPDARRILRAVPDLSMRESAHAFYRGDGTPWPDFAARVRKFLRQNAGKSQNFGELYGGGEDTTQRTTRVKAGIEVSLARCRAFHDLKAAKYPEREVWRNSLIESAVRDGAVHLPLIGLSRTFGGTREQIEREYREQILDFPVQAHSAAVMHSAIEVVLRAFTHLKLRAHVVANWHDGMVIDSHARDFVQADKIVKNALAENPYIAALCEYYRRGGFPLEYEREIMSRNLRRTPVA